MSEMQSENRRVDNAKDLRPRGYVKPGAPSDPISLQGACPAAAASRGAMVVAGKRFGKRYMALREKVLQMLVVQLK